MSVTIVYGFPLDAIIPGGQVTVETIGKDAPYPPPVDGEINVPMSPMTYAMHRNVPNFNYPTGSGGGDSLYQQQGTLAAGATSIVITLNGGVLSTNNDQVILFFPSGVVPQTYTINRAANPDQITGLTAQIDDTPYLILTWISAA